jgi:ABC-type hemin transport system ATPase subunit
VLLCSCRNPAGFNVGSMCADLPTIQRKLKHRARLIGAAAAAAGVLCFLHDCDLGSMYADLHSMPFLRATTGLA